MKLDPHLWHVLFRLNNPLISTSFNMELIVRLEPEKPLDEERI